MRMVGAFLLSMLMFFSFFLHAGVVITGTRVVFPSSKNEVTVALTNKGTQAALVQSWIDTGDPTELPQKINVPFAIIPPLIRMDANKGYSLRIIHTGGELPSDRESVFWLNVLSVPPKSGIDDETSGQYLKVAFQTRIKLFFRPQNLKPSSDSAMEKLQWQKKGNGFSVINPTPYYISLLDVSWRVSTEEFYLDGGMIAPFSSIDLSGGENKISLNTHVLSYRVINDLGGVQHFEVEI